ncbi:ATP-dependent DNA helicase, partial [Candidatus Bathyarchaeota archaeon]|nr:ATP-dependent DNA helicase [Candidatus Bathyarchaeota archaeon]
GIFGINCQYFEKTYEGKKPSESANNLLNRIKKIGPLLPDEVYNICRDEGLCPYEVTKVLTKDADIMIGSYNYILINAIRGSILGSARMSLQEVNCVFDEAHSLPYYAANLLSEELSTRSVGRAYKEAEKFGTSGSDLLRALYKSMIKLGKKAYRKCGLDTEHLIRENVLFETVSDVLGINYEQLLDAVEELVEAGEIVRQKRSEEGKNPISYIARCADFLLNWKKATGLGYVRYVKVDEDDDKRKHVRLGIRCLDPALTASVINELRSAILMSGTLWHRKYYIDVLGLEENRCQELELPSPFPRENRLLLVDKAVTTKFEKRNEIQWRRIADHLQQIIQNMNGRVAVYFPSYDIMRKISELLKDDYPALIERKRTKISEVLNFLKRHKKCVILGVARGKISEGVDMTTEGRSLLSAVILVGLPFPKKTELQEALYRYFDEKFGTKAMEYASIIPCLNALAQSAGRLLRSPKDRGVVIIMDSRAAGWFKHKLPEDW